MKKLFVSVLATALSLSAVCSPVSCAKAENSEKTLKIMPVGDSITDGYWEQGGYRKYMSYQFSQRGFNFIDLVGPKGADSETFDYNGQQVSYDGNYAGYSGYAIQYIEGTETRQGILETLQDGDYIKTFKPDIVLLQIGTNDILSAYNEGITDRLENLVTYILNEMDNPESTVYISTIPDIDVKEVESWLWAYGEVKWNSSLDEFTKIVQGYVDSYNASIPLLVEKMQSDGKNVQFADIHSVVDMKSDLYDGVHPNEQGYEKMGIYWAGLITEKLSRSSNPENQDTTKPSEPSDEMSFNVADLVSLSNYLLGRKDHGITAEKASAYDLTKDGKLSVADLVQMRKACISSHYTAIPYEQ